jgi:hypothetical protein
MVMWMLTGANIAAQKYAAFEDNRGRFNIFDDGKIIEAEYLPTKSFYIGGNCVLYIDSRNNLKMYYNGEIKTIGLNISGGVEARDYLSAFSIGSTIKIIENGEIATVSTNSIKYDVEDSLVTFYDMSRSLLAVYYKGSIHMLEDGLMGKPYNNFKSGSNVVAYISSRTRDFKIFYNGVNRVIEPFLNGGNFTAGKNIVAWVNQSDLKFRIFYKDEIFEAEEFSPESWQVGDDITAYVDNTGSFKVFAKGEVNQIASFKPDFYQVRNHMVIYGEQNYFKVWLNNRIYSLENYIPADWKAEWNSMVYVDQNRNVKIFSNGDTGVLTYDMVEDVELYRDVVVVNKGMNNHNIYYKGKKY